MRTIIIDELDLNTFPPSITIHLERIYFDEFVNFIMENMNSVVKFYVKNENLINLLNKELPLKVTKTNEQYIYHPNDEIFLVKNDGVWWLRSVEI
jgi:hypothetical protein